MKLLAILLLLFATQASFADKISLRADEWCPYNCTPGSENPGYMIEIAKAIFEKEGHQVEYKTLPWARAIKETRDGKHTAIVGAVVSEAPDFIFPSRLGFTEDHFYVKKDFSWKFDGKIESIKNLRLGVIKEYSYTDEIDKYISKNKNSKYVQHTYGDSPLDKNIKKLEIGRIDTLIANINVFNYKLIKLEKTKETFRDAGKVSSENIYLAFSPKVKKAKEYKEIFDNGLIELRKSGQLEQILLKYGLQDWEK